MKIALIGLGMVAETHLAAIADSSELRLSTVWSRSPEASRAFAQAATSSLGYTPAAPMTIEAIALDPNIDFAILATPPDARAEILHLLAAHLKPVLMEKPIERTLQAAADLVALCEAASLPLGIVFQHRVRAASVALKAVIDKGVLGGIATVELRVPWWRDQGYYDAPGRGTYARDGGGVMISQAIHTLDLALWVLGPVQTVQAMTHTTPLHQMEAEDWAGALLSFENGAVGTLMASTAAFPGNAESIHIQGTKAAAHLAAGVLQLHHLDGRTETFGATATTGGGADPMAFTHEWHKLVIEDFAAALRQSQPPLVSGRCALAAHNLIDAMERAARSGTTESLMQ